MCRYIGRLGLDLDADTLADSDFTSTRKQRRLELDMEQRRLELDDKQRSALEDLDSMRSNRRLGTRRGKQLQTWNSTRATAVALGGDSTPNDAVALRT